VSTQKVQDLLDDTEPFGKQGNLPEFAWPGGYTIFYITARGDTLCAKCATEEIVLWQAGESEDPPVDYGAFGATDDYPVDDCRCDNCSEVICEGNGEFE